MDHNNRPFFLSKPPSPHLDSLCTKAKAKIYICCHIIYFFCFITYGLYSAVLCLGQIISKGSEGWQLHDMVLNTDDKAGLIRS